MFLVGQEGVGRGRKEEDWGGVDWIWTPAAAAAERECLCAQRREPLQIGVSVVRDSGENRYVAADLVLSTASFPAPPWNSCRTSLASTGFFPSTSPCMGQQNSGVQFGYSGLSPATRVCFCHMAALQRFVERYEHSHFAQLAGLTFQTSPTVPLEQFLAKYQTVDFTGLVTTRAADVVRLPQDAEAPAGAAGAVAPGAQTGCLLEASGGQRRLPQPLAVRPVLEESAKVKNWVPCTA